MYTYLAWVESVSIRFSCRDVGCKTDFLEDFEVEEGQLGNGDGQAGVQDHEVLEPGSCCIFLVCGRDIFLAHKITH